MTRARRRLLVSGTVQGLGFRPFIYRLAQRLGLAGWVRNTAAGVLIEVEGAAGDLAGFERFLHTQRPRHSRIVDCQRQDLCATGQQDFAILASDAGSGGALDMLPDLASCAPCLAEVFDPSDRRFHYPFTNCTACGPRYSILVGLPWDRPATSMAGFSMCAACQAEYDDPGDRRFHAQPNACPACGPQISLWDPSSRRRATRGDALQASLAALCAGRVLAVKGLGGFLLMVDARDAAAVARLRERKRRPHKPLALLIEGPEQVGRVAHAAAAERQLLEGPAAPICLLRSLPRNGLAANVAPGRSELGVMLPAFPLLHLLARGIGFPLVATSGNLSGEPLCIENDAAHERLAGIADLFLEHDRPILRPLDDAVVRVVAGAPQVLRRGRGYAPAPHSLAAELEPALAFGAQLKSCVAVAAGTRVVCSQELGELGSRRSLDLLARTVAELPRLSGIAPRRLVCDLHPDYASTRLAEQHARASGLPLHAVQHHLAHVASVMAEHGLQPPLLGVAWDGSGFGRDGSLWGGEFLELSTQGVRRCAHLRSFPLPGGELAVREPRRAALGLLWQAGLRGAELQAAAPTFLSGELQVLHRAMERGLNSPRCSSVGRLFDGWAALLGVCQRSSYEGQAACLLEALAEGADPQPASGWILRRAEHPWQIDFEPALRGLLADLQSGRPTPELASALQVGLVDVLLQVAQQLGHRQVVLSGGCFQNRSLLEGAVVRLRAAGFEPYWPQSLPPGDGGLAMGQLWAAQQEELCAWLSPDRS